MKNQFLCRRGVSALRAALVVFCLIAMGTASNEAFGQTTWKAPASADNYKNPYAGKTAATASGKTLYDQMCAICHGDKGKGDGLAGMTLKPRPANFKKDEIQGQTDGAIYWKIAEGRAPMAAYKGALTEEQRWRLVNYIRQLGDK